MIKNFLEIHSEEDVSNAIGLFLNKDIKKATFSDITFEVIATPQVPGNFVLENIEFNVYIGDDRMYHAEMDNNVYDLVVKAPVREEINAFKTRGY